MGTQDDRHLDIEVEVLDENGVERVIANALAEAKCNLEELQRQARIGRFSSNAAQRAWFIASSFVD